MKKNVILIFVLFLGLSWYTAITETVNNPKKEQEYLKKAEELEEKGIYVDAVTEYENALQYDPENPEIFVKMAQAYLNSGNSNKFTSVCEQTAETCQDDTKALDTLMNYYVENDCEYKAVKYLNGFMESYPENQNAREWFVKLKGSYEELYCFYDELSGIVNDSMVTKREELYGLTDAKGAELIKTQYRKLYPLSKDGFALAQREDNSYIYVDKKGQTRKVPDVSYEELGMFESGRAAACKDGKYGYLDEEMKPAGAFEWDSLTGIRHNVGAAEKDGKWSLVKADGKPKGDERYEDVIVDENGFCSAQKRIFVKKGKDYELIDSKGKKIGDKTFSDAKAFTEKGYAAVCRDGKWGFADKDGKLVIKCAYEDARSFQNGFAAVKKDGLWGYVDEEGNLVIEPKFLLATDISGQGTAAVKMQVSGEEEWKLIQLNIFL